MGSVLDAIVDAVSDLIDAIVDVVQAVWNSLVVPILEGVFSIFGIEDETVVSVQKVSIAVLGDEPNNIVKKALSRTVIQMSDNGAGFYRNYVANFNRHKGQIAGYYHYANNGPYVHGLPTMVIEGTNLDYAAIDLAINTALSGTYTVLSADTTYPSPEVWFKNFLQSAPYNYLPWADTLTKDAANGESYSDWSVGAIVFNNTSMEYDIPCTRNAELSHIMIEASDTFVDEGGTTTLDITLNRAVPVGETLTVNLTYTGATGAEFNGPSSVVMNAGDTAAVVTLDTIAPSAVKRLDIEISFTDTSAFESLSVVEARRTTSVVLVPTGVIALCIGQIPVQEGSTATIPVTLSAASVAFSVNWQATDTGSAIEGSDFTASSGTLNFTGTANETINVTVPILADGLPESFETLEITLSGISTGTVNDTVAGLVRITDAAISLPSAVSGDLTEIISQPNYSKERHLIVTYHEDSDPSSEWFYWLYRLEDNTYPDIDPTSSSISNLEMLPVAILRKNKQFINEAIDIPNDLLEDFGEHTQVYKTTRNILNKVNLRVKDVIESLAENPDIDAIDDVYVNFAMNPMDSNQVLSKLLWLHFYEIIVVNGVTSNTESYSATFTEQDVNNALVWNAHSHNENIAMTDSEMSRFVAKFNVVKIGDYFHSTEDDFLRVFKKISATHVDYLQVDNIASMSAIAYDGFHNVTFNKIGEEAFTIPVSWFLIRKLSGPETIELFPYIFRLDIFSIQITELAWYQTSAFKVFFQIAMIIITIATLGTTSYWAVLGQMLFQYAVVQIVIYIAELTGNAELAAIVGIVATIYFGMQAGMNFDLTGAEGLTNVVTVFSSSMGAAQTGELNTLQDDLADLLEDFEKQKDLLAEQDTSTGMIGGAEYWSLKSSEANLYEAGPIQFNFDLLFDYDNLVGNYFDQQLNVGL